MSRIGTKKRSEGLRGKTASSGTAAPASKARASASASRQATTATKKGALSHPSHDKIARARRASAGKGRHQVRERDDVVRAQIDKHLQGARDSSATISKSTIAKESAQQSRRNNPSMQATIASLEGLKH